MASPIDETIDQVLSDLTFTEGGLIPAVAQQHDSGEVLMMAWMNKDAIAATLREGRAIYWSRSRGKLWRKGESSGQVQDLVEFRWDCDNDTILLQVNQTGVACHTGRRSCFYQAVRNGNVEIIADVITDPDDLYAK